MADEYIKRSDVLRIVSRRLKPCNALIGDLCNACEDVCRMVEQIPSADVQPAAHGKWEVFHEPDTNAYECTACHDVFWLSDGTPFENNYYFCPNCGANMQSNAKLMPSKGGET